MMQLRKVDEKTWVNVGDGNVTSVVDAGYERRRGHERKMVDLTLINIIGGRQLEIARPAHAVVSSLENVGGFGR